MYFRLFHLILIQMGKITKGILGPFSGKVGAVVGSSWKGVDYIKSLPGPNTSNTVKQQVQRGRFKSVVSLASSLQGTLIRPVWNKSAVKMTGSNLFVKTNMNAFDTDGELVNYSQFHASVGSLALPANLQIQDGAVNSGVEVSWTDESASGIGSADDQLHLVAVRNGVANVMHTNLLRSAQSAEIILPLGAGVVHVYAFFGKADGSQYSSDKYQDVSLT
jgi:hypothetical protein